MNGDVNVMDGIRLPSRFMTSGKEPADLAALLRQIEATDIRVSERTISFSCRPLMWEEAVEMARLAPEMEHPPRPGATWCQLWWD